MKTPHLETNNSLGRIHRPTALAAVLTGALVLASPLALAQTNVPVTWHRQAQGQEFTCPIRQTKWTWPNNNNWSQTQLIGDPCSEGASVILQPSNWSTTDYPNGLQYDVVLGSWGGAAVNLDVGVTLNSLTIQSDGGPLNMQYGSSITANTFVFHNDSGISIGGGGGATPVLAVAQGGTLTKAAGAGVFTFTPGMVLRGSSATFTVASGSLALPGSGSSYSNCTFQVPSNWYLYLVPPGESATVSGVVLGAEGGTLLMNAGTLNADAGGATLMLPGSFFQWTGGTLVGMNNQSNVTVSGSGEVGIGGTFNNRGTLRFVGDGGLNQPWGTSFNNQADGTVDFQTDAGFTIGGGGGANPSFNNQGLVRKSGGTNKTSIASLFNNQGGKIQVDGGTLSLSGGGGSSNGTFVVASGAVLDLTGGGVSTWAGEVRGSGAGQVPLNGGVLSGNPSLTLNLPDGLFQWAGGQLAGTTINSNVITLAASSAFSRGGVMQNRSLFRHTGTTTLWIPGDSHYENLAGGTYDFEGDGSVVPGGGSGANPFFNNQGLVRKSGGSGTATVGVDFNNQDGSIEVDSGTLMVGAYSQGSGSLTVKLGGRGAGQFGQLGVVNGAVLDGALTVSLTNGFAPVLGDSFQLLSCGSRSGTFSTTRVPAGISVNYSNSGVFLVVTGAVPAQITSPTLAGGNFAFSFGTASNQSYTIQRNDDLTTTDWVYFTNFTGNGSLMQVLAPLTNAPRRFFRVRQP